MDKFLIIDGNSILYRAFYALPLLNNEEGIYTNAVYGFCNILVKALKEIEPKYVCVAFDYGKKTFRNEMYSEYKATRKETPMELVMQFPIVKEALSAMNIKYIEIEGFEGDDVVGSLSKKFPDVKTIILTGDRDNLQLIDSSTDVYLTKKGITELIIYDEKQLLLEKGITPSQVVDVKAIMGDASDNIPGVGGIGEKGAYSLIAKYGSLDGVYANLFNLTLSQRTKLINDKENAYLSLKLGTIKTDCEIPYSLESFMLSLPFGMEFYNVCTKYSFSTILKNKTLFNVETEQKTTYQIENIENENKLIETLNEYANSEFVALDLNIETNILSFAFNGDKVYEIVMTNSALIMNFLLLPIKKIVFDLKEFKRVFTGYISNIESFEDIALMYYLLYANDKVVTKKDFCIKYESSHIVNAIIKNYLSIFDMLKSNGLLNLYNNVEKPLINVLYNMEENGIKIDENTLNKISNKIDEEYNENVTEIYKLLGHEINLNSPKQLAETLFDELNIFVPGNKKRSTSSEILKKIELAHPIVPLIQKYRSLMKVKSTYIDVYKLSSNNSYINARFLQMVTGTGRLSCKDPNLQNIPVRNDEMKNIREIFVSRFENGYLLSFDYDQIELKLMAHFSQDETLINSFLQGKDVHATVASKIFNVPIESVTKEQRRRAKTVNFGTIYGQGAFGLSETLGISIKSAKEFIESYFENFPKVKKYMQLSVEKAKENNCVARTMLNRMRYIPELKSTNFQLRSFGERVAVNMPIQGSASDIIKLAMIAIDGKIENKKLKSKLILQIHDELVFDVPEDEIEEIKTIVKKEMENAVSISVPLTVSLEIGKTLNK